jgi:Fe-S-cluster containining protein
VSDASAYELPDEIEELEELEEDEEEEEEEEDEEEEEEDDEEEEEAIDPALLAQYCGKCRGRCCKYYTIIIDEPEDADDYDEVRWFLAHEGCYVYIDEGQWHVNVVAGCRFLGDEGRCKIYEHRPDVCREFGHEEECEFTGELDFEHTFKDLRELEEYAKTVLSKKEYAKLPSFPRNWKGPV